MKEETTTNEFKVGQKLYAQASNYRGAPRIIDFTISRVGKKYLYLVERPRWRIDRSTLFYTHFQGYEKFYTNKEELRERLNKEYLWNRIRGLLVAINPPEGLTLEQIRTAALALGVVKEEDEDEV